MSAHFDKLRDSNAIHVCGEILTCDCGCRTSKARWILCAEHWDDLVAQQPGDSGGDAA